MKNLRMFIKLMVSFLIITAFTVVVACVGIYSTTSINGNYVYLIDAPVERQTYLQQIQTDFMTMRYRAANFVMNSGDADYINNTAVPQYQAACASLQKNLTAYVQSNNSDVRRDPATLRSNIERASSLSGLIAQYEQFPERALSLALSGDAQAANAALKDAIPTIGEIDALLEEMITPASSFVDETAEYTGQYANSMMIVQIGLSVFCIVFALVFAAYIAGSISKPLITIVNFLNKASATGDFSFGEEEQKNVRHFAKAKDEIGELSNSLSAFVLRIHDVSRALEAVAGGDLTCELALLSETDTMGGSMQKMLHNLNNMFGDINASTAQVSNASKQIADGAQALAQGSTEQAAAVEQLSNSISEIAQKTTANADMADKTALLAGTIKDSAQKGSSQMDEMMTAVKDINEASQNISKVIKVINDIAFQTNILALNAAVEAAHAGQHGKGFAVVAEEVGSLAAKSAEAAKDTEGLIANSIEKAELGARIAGETAASLVDIVSGINEAGRMVDEIAMASEQQSAGITEINKGIEQVVQVIQQNSATAQQSAAASEEMSGQAGMLEELLAQFKLKNGETMRIASASPSTARKKKRPAPGEAAYAAMEDNSGFGKY